MILVVDNYDSFTWNLVHYLREIGAEVRVERNDSLSAAEAMASGADAILISPGPGTPDEAGISLALVAACDHNASQVRQAASDRRDARHHARVRDEHASAAVGEQLGVVLAREMGRDRHRHGADAYRAEERRDELR